MLNFPSFSYKTSNWNYKQIDYLKNFSHKKKKKKEKIWNFIIDSNIYYMISVFRY